MTDKPRDVTKVLDALMRLGSAARDGSGRSPSRLRVESGENAVELEWWDPDGLSPARPRARPTASLPPEPDPGPPEAPASSQPDLHHVTAPMLGTFYRAAAPGEAPFVQVGDLVSPGQQVGILEAMKLMNPVEADRAGRVVEILVADASPVEYDQRLMSLSPIDEQ